MQGRIVPLLLLSGLGCASCERVEGPATSQPRGVDAFHSIELRGTGTLDVLVGERQSLVVEAGGDTLDQLTTEVRNGRLVIESRGRWFWQRAGGRLKVRATLPKLNALDLNGAGQITINGLAGGETTLVLSGAGGLEATGRVDVLTIRVNGAGSIDASRLQAVDVEATVNGAGSIEVDVAGRLDATVNGVGSISYSGKPTQLNTRLNGVGSIGPR